MISIGVFDQRKRKKQHGQAAVFYSSRRQQGQSVQSQGHMSGGMHG